MKQGFSGLQRVVDASHVAQQMHGLRDSVARSSTSAHGQASVPGRAASSGTLGAHMRHQFGEHMEKSTTASSGESFVQPLLAMVGQECVQVLLLKARAAFTELVEKCMDEGSIFDVEDIIKHARAAVITSVSDEQSKSTRTALNALQTVLQEHQYTAANLASTADPVTMWENEMRFYRRPGHMFQCRCAGHAVPVNPETMDRDEDTVLITTDVTKDVRRAFFHAAFGGANALLVEGPPGTGKTETVKDICHMLGKKAEVISGGMWMPEMIDWNEMAQKGSVLVIDEANRLSRSSIEAFVFAANSAGVLLCFASNPLTGSVQDIVGNFCAYVKTEIPDRPILLSSMMACEGFQEADALGERLANLFKYYESNCTQQPYYDWGLRKLKAVTREAGKAARVGAYIDERQSLIAALQASCASAMHPLDENIFLRGLVEHFGADAFVPMPVPRDFWNAAATKISRTVNQRHGSLCVPVLESEETFVLAVLEEEAAKAGAAISCMPARSAELSTRELIGAMKNGEWVDGAFTKALKDVVSQEQPGWLVVFCGNEEFDKQKWNHFNSLLDDNKILCLETGERIALRPQDRIIFMAPSVQGASPATISRLGIVNVECHHRNRL